MQRINQAKMDPLIWDTRMSEACVLFDAAVDIAQHRLEDGESFVLEHPGKASSWERSSVQRLCLLYPQVKLIVFDQCCFGLKSPLGEPMMKTTKFLTNLQTVVDRFSGVRCKCQVPHRQIEGNQAGVKLSWWAQHYPAPLVQALVDCARA